MGNLDSVLEKTERVNYELCCAMDVLKLVLNCLAQIDAPQSRTAQGSVCAVFDMLERAQETANDEETEIISMIERA